ncbi:hypothetical protein JCM9534A_48500 [Catenuloplanes indicus JCM 9534]
MPRGRLPLSPRLLTAGLPSRLRVGSIESRDRVALDLSEPGTGAVAQTREPSIYRVPRVVRQTLTDKSAR